MFFCVLILFSLADILGVPCTLSAGLGSGRCRVTCALCFLPGKSLQIWQNAFRFSGWMSHLGTMSEDNFFLLCSLIALREGHIFSPWSWGQFQECFTHVCSYQVTLACGWLNGSQEGIRSRLKTSRDGEFSSAFNSLLQFLIENYFIYASTCMNQALTFSLL